MPEKLEQVINTDKRLLNLRPRWKSGESGNPAGRPKSSITSILREKLEQIGEDGRSKAEIVADILYEMATSKGSRGQMPALIELLDRIEGKVADKHLNVNVSITPESLQAAQERLLLAQADTKALLEHYSKGNDATKQEEKQR